MKIALIAASPQPIPATRGGATETMMTHLLDVNEEIKQHEFYVFSYYESSAKQESLNYKHSKFYFYSPNVWKDVIETYFFRALRVLTNHRIYLRSNFIRFCADIILKGNFDVIILQGNCFHAQYMRSLIKDKLVLHMHIDRLNAELKETRSIINSVDNLIAISNFCKSQMLKVCPEKSEKIFVLKNTIDTDKFNDENKEELRKSIRKSLGIKEDQILISYCGRVVEDKGVLELIRAIKLLNNKRVTLMIIGSSFYADGKKSKFMRILEKEANDILGGVVFTGYIFQKDLPKYIKSADIAVLPSKCQEAAGNVIIEALACGTPVIASMQGGIPEYADVSACQLVKCDENFILNLKLAIKELLDNSSLYYTKAKNSRQVALKYNKYNYYTNFTDVLNKICK